jgi:hypothetical protein
MASPSPASEARLGRHQVETLIIERIWKDPAFKKEFLADPKGSIEKYSGQKFPAEVKIVVHEEDGKTMHLSIPPAPANLNELSDEDLERVAGGTDAITTVIVGIITAAATSIVTAGASIANDQTRARFGW